MLLLITKNEENSFWLLVEIVENIVPGSYILKLFYCFSTGLLYNIDF